MTESTLFTQLAALKEDSSGLLQSMIDHYRRNRQPVELFEALKMRVRSRLGLPLISGDQDEVRAEEIDQQLESGLLDACREAGAMFIQDGRVREGWMYLRPTGDTALARRLLTDVPITDENYDEMIQVLLHEGVDVGRGYQTLVDHQGTCNSITTYEQSIMPRPRRDRQAAARVLLDHLYGELVTLVRGDIIRREAPAGDYETLGEMIERRKWILQDGGYHLDTTHLASTVRIASVLEDRPSLQKAYELTQYGRRLAQHFQYPGDEPFVDFYPAYGTFYRTLLGDDVDQGIKFFERRARSVDVRQHGTGAIETYVDLLDRCGRSNLALSEAISLVPDNIPAQRMVPLLLEFASRVSQDDRPGAYRKILYYSEKQNDALGYVATCHAMAASKQT
jgi:hypothetical protein